MSSVSPHQRVCPHCGVGLGYAHADECEFSGPVIYSQAIDLKEQTRCSVCQQRVGQQHLPQCPRAGIVEDSPLVTDPDQAPGGSAEIADRAAAVRQELEPSSEEGGEVVLVEMHPDAPTTAEGVLRAVPGSTAIISQAAVVVGLWPTGHVVVAKNRYGKSGVGRLLSGLDPSTEFEWPVLFWGVSYRLDQGPAGSMRFEGVPPERRDPERDYEPYVPVRHLRAAIKLMLKEAEERGNELERVLTLRTVSELLDNEILHIESTLKEQDSAP